MRLRLSSVYKEVKAVNLERIRACINLHAILRNLEDLGDLDDDARTLLAGHDLRIGMHVPGIEPLTLAVKDGAIRAKRGSEAGSLRLQFASPRHFNGMVGGSSMPLTTGGFKHLGFLKGNFAALAKDLEKYLRPGADDLKDPAFRDKNTRLTASAAMYALSEIANADSVGQQIVRAMGEGTAVIEVPGVLAHAIQSKDGRLTTSRYEGQGAQAFMRFDSLDTLGRVLRGELDSYLCIGRGQIAISGRVPMMDNINKLLRMVSFYLA